VDETTSPRLDRRTVLRIGGYGVAAAVAGTVLPFKRLPVASAATKSLPDIQFDVRQFLGPLKYFDENGVELPPDQDNPLQFQFGPVFTKFVTFKLTKDVKRFEPTKADRKDFSEALDRLEAVYPFSPSGVFVFLAYGMPYFNRLPRTMVDRHMPRLVSDSSRWAMEEARPAPTDYGQPGVNKPQFKVPVQITDYDILMTLRSDSEAIIDDVVDWLRGSNKLKGQSITSPQFSDILALDTTRSLMVSQPGWTRRLADAKGMEFRQNVHPRSPMWMGFADQHRIAAGPAPIVTFQGNASAKVTDAAPGSYFDNGSVQHFSHVLLDLDTWKFPTYSTRVGYMFRHNPPPAAAYTDPATTSPPTNDGGPAYVVNEFRDPGDAEQNAKGIGTPGGEPSMGHTTALQRSSRAADGTPMHIRLDGPGWDKMDMDLPGVPDRYRGKEHPKLQFSIFVPSADFFDRMRRNGSARDLTEPNGVLERANGLEFYTTTTRRQNFLVPPRRHRAFPLVDLTREVTDGYDTKLGKLLSEDKKVYPIISADNDHWQVEAGATTTLQFEGGVPAGATIRRVVIFVRHYEEKDIGRSPLVWKVGGGSVRNATVFGTTTPAVFIDKEAEQRAEWDVTRWITTPARANDLKFVIQNKSPQGKKSYVNNVYVWVDHT